LFVIIHILSSPFLYYAFVSGGACGDGSRLINPCVVPKASLAHERSGFEFGTLIGIGSGKSSADDPSRCRERMGNWGVLVLGSAHPFHFPAELLQLPKN
jgi:hypothetical protein